MNPVHGPPGAPNVVIITCDDLGRFLSCYGNRTVRSPNIDKFASQGVLFRNAFCTSPQCSPSRASLFTGRYPQSNGVLGLTHAPFSWRLRGNERHLAQELKSIGYVTASFGKLHETDIHDRTVAIGLGFDHIEPPHVNAEIVASQVTTWMKEIDPARPFYLQIGFIEPHRIPGARDDAGTTGFIGDHIVPDEGMGVAVPSYLVDDGGVRVEMSEVQGAVRYVDRAIGRVLDSLDSLTIENNTLVVFTSDHGLAMPRAKCSLYDPGIEIPLVIRYPRRGWVGGREIDSLVSNIDIFPTVIEAVEKEVSPRVEGSSLAPMLDGDIIESIRSEIYAQLTYHEYYDPRRCVRTDSCKLIANFTAAPTFMDPTQSWYRRSRAKASSNQYHKSLELYDLSQDPTEVADVSETSSYEDVRRELISLLSDWMKVTKDPLLDGAVMSPLHEATLELIQKAH